MAAALAATVLCPVATSSGDELERRVGDLGSHAALGDQLVWFALALLASSALLVFLQRRGDRSLRSTSTPMLTIVAVVAVIAGLAAGVQVYRVGDSGARAAWGEVADGAPGR
ncbi:MAG: hypothetical protein H0X12_17660 [Nocardioides sp.]|nr:hypothetical protein [Nocardioides sp.]